MWSDLAAIWRPIFLHRKEAPKLVSLRRVSTLTVDEPPTFVLTKPDNGQENRDMLDGAPGARRIGRRRAMTDGNKISFADEQVGLAKCDAVANELSGARHDEQPVTILLDLRSLVGVVRVLDGEIVQLELLLYAGQERDIRFVQPDPHHMARPAAPARSFVYGNIGDASAIDIGAGCDDSFGVGGLRRQDG